MNTIRTLALVALSFFSSTAFAQSTGVSGFDALNLKMPTDGSGIVSLFGSKALAQGVPHFGLNLSYNYHLISMTQNNIPRWLVEYVYAGDFVAAIGLFDFMSLGAEVPFAFYESVTNNATGINYKEASLGDVRFDLKFRILEDKSWHPGIAIIPSVFVPSGNVDDFTGNTGMRYQGLLVVDKDFGPVYLVLNAGFRFVQKKTVITRVIDDELLYGLGVAIPLPVWNNGLSVLIEGRGSSVVRDLSKHTSSLEAIGGLRKTFQNGLRVDLGGSGGIIKAMGTPAFRVLLGMGYTMPTKDRVKTATPSEPVREINETISFPHGGWRVDPSLYAQLRSIGQQLADNPELQIIVEGYSDSTGKARYNQTLSERRADAVKKLLVYFGAQKGQIKATGLGTGNPITSNDTIEGRAKNRRVVIMNK